MVRKRRAGSVAKVPRVTEGPLTDQTCSQAARLRCATLLAMRQPNSSEQDRQEQRLVLWNARTCRHFARAKVASKSQDEGKGVRTAKTEGHASVV